MIRPTSLALLCAAALQSSAAQSAQRTAAADSALLRTVSRTEVAFFNKWREAWMARVSADSATFQYWQRGLHETFPGPGAARPGSAEAEKGDAYMRRIHRAGAFHCRAWLAQPNLVGWMKNWAGVERLIPSPASTGGLCPNWLTEDGLPNLGPPADSLARASMTGAVLATRTTLIALIDSAARLMPGNGWMAGQQVRLHLDEGDLAGAMDAARSCRTNRWWCSSLAGLVLSVAGDVVAADSAFRAGVAATAGEARCQWTDVGLLLPLRDREAYTKMSCEERDSVSTNLWWLADPLFAQAGN